MPPSWLVTEPGHVTRYVTGPRPKPGPAVVVGLGRLRTRRGQDRALRQTARQELSAWRARYIKTLVRLASDSRCRSVQPAGLACGARPASSCSAREEPAEPLLRFVDAERVREPGGIARIEVVAAA
jgi:hypothetical protein